MDHKTGQESPQSISFVGYYKGFSVTVTKRDPEAKVLPLIESAKTAIDSMIEEGWKPSWNSETNKQVVPDSEKWLDPPIDPEICKHTHIETKVSGGFKKPENKGKMYSSCLDCKKFLSWVN